MPEGVVYRDPSAPIDERLADLLAAMTVAEKVGQMQCLWGPTVRPDPGDVDVPPGSITHFLRGGAFEPREAARRINAHQRAYLDTRLGIPALFSEEVLCGLQVNGGTVLPDGINQASTFDPDLIEQLGAMVRSQMLALGIRQTLGPLCDVARDPRWGRIEESYGEDPYLVGTICSAFVRGVQGDSQTSAVVKHFVAHGASEAGRHMQPVHIGARELREVQGLPFEMAVRDAGVTGVMSTYHAIDHVPMNASRELLVGLLRDEYGFEGVCISDLYALIQLHTLHFVTESARESAVLALRSGLDVDMSGVCFAELVQAVEHGIIAESELDEAVTRVLRQKFELGLFEQPFADESAVPAILDGEPSRGLARAAAQRSIVLLRNEADLLPLSPVTRSVAVIGPNAHRARALLGNYSFPAMRANDVGRSGEWRPASAHDPIMADRRISPDDAGEAETLVAIPTVLDAIGARGADVRYARGCGITDPDRSGFDAAVEAARACDVAIVVVGDQSGIMTGATVGEFVDSMTCELPGVQRALVEAVVSTGTPVVVVLCNGRPFVLGWMTEIVDAIVEAWFPGEEGANAIAEVLFGDVNPGGKLPVSFPRTAGSSPSPYNAPFNSFVPKDSIYYEGSHEPLFGFGHGLSYTTFGYSDLTIEPTSTTTAGVVTIACTVTNTGDRAGDEVVQLYLSDPIARTVRPPLELKGFRRITLDPGARARVAFEVAADRVALYEPAVGWMVEPGAIDVMVASSSRDIRLRGAFTLDGSPRVVGDERILTTPVRVG